jgi:hypothetical protein
MKVMIFFSVLEKEQGKPDVVQETLKNKSLNLRFLRAIGMKTSHLGNDAM